MYKMYMLRNRENQLVVMGKIWPPQARDVSDLVLVVCYKGIRYIAINDTFSKSFSKPKCAFKDVHLVLPTYYQ